jgi:hypothetical protein
MPSISRRSFQKGMEDLAIGKRLEAWWWVVVEARTQMQTLWRIS